MSDEMQQLTEKPLTFESGPNTLAGTLVLPATPGPWPGVVILGGSERSDRDNLLWLARCSAERGVAGFCFDFPGTGQSTGDRVRHTMHDRATDAASCVAMLKRQPELTGQAVGLWGLSQGGWVAQETLGERQVGDFGVIVAGPGVSGFEQSRYRAESECRIAKLDEDSVAKALLLFDLSVEWARAGLGAQERAMVEKSCPVLNAQYWAHRVMAWHEGDVWSEMLSALNAPDALRPLLERNVKNWDARGEKWLHLLMCKQYGLTAEFALGLYFEGFRNLPAIMAPRESYIRAIRVPVLVLFGELDPLSPVPKDVAIYERCLSESRHPDYTIKVIEGQGHFPHRPEDLELQVRWVQERFCRDGAGC
ncbi:MAG TPA: alpha/beta fold hydrolase [Tepidisphaeraceae bacterium]|nr:alpha/beta fold hydrolase [Tepidisphaeraceae bacterium]